MSNQVLNVGRVLSFHRDFGHICTSFFILILDSVAHRTLCSVRRTSVGHELHSRLDDLHSRNFERFLAFVETAEHSGVLHFPQEQGKAGQVSKMKCFII